MIIYCIKCREKMESCEVCVVDENGEEKRYKRSGFCINAACDRVLLFAIGKETPDELLT